MSPLAPHPPAPTCVSVCEQRCPRGDRASSVTPPCLTMSPLVSPCTHMCPQISMHVPCPHMCSHISMHVPMRVLPVFLCPHACPPCVLVSPCMSSLCPHICLPVSPCLSSVSLCLSPCPCVPSCPLLSPCQGSFCPQLPPGTCCPPCAVTEGSLILTPLPKHPPQTPPGPPVPTEAQARRCERSLMSKQRTACS